MGTKSSDTNLKEATASALTALCRFLTSEASVAAAFRSADRAWATEFVHTGVTALEPAHDAAETRPSWRYKWNRSSMKQLGGSSHRRVTPEAELGANAATIFSTETSAIETHSVSAVMEAHAAVNLRARAKMIDTQFDVSGPETFVPGLKFEALTIAAAALPACSNSCPMPAKAVCAAC